MEEYFFGGWRAEMPELDAIGEVIDLRKFRWERFYRSGLLWASALGDWARVRRLSEYPGDDTPGWEESGKLAPYYRAIASMLIGRPDAESRLNEIRLGRRKDRRFLAEAVLAISAREVAAAQKATNSYLKHYLTHEFPQPRVTAKLSEEGSFLVHFAAHLGVPIEVDPRYMDHIVTLHLQKARN